jgi:hypothetical protein
VVVCDAAGCDEPENGFEVAAPAVELREDVELELAASVGDAAWEWSCHASRPPSESMAATLTAVTALRARAARGGRRRRVRAEVVSSMTVKLRTARERRARAG